jgi:Family of unknown function (DUF6065)
MMMYNTDNSVSARFYQLIPGAPKPRRADRSAEGRMPMRAYRYCEAMRTASAFGWYFYPPINFRLLLEGNELFWTYEGADGRYPLGGAQFPGFSRFFEERAPDALKRFAPPFLAAGDDPGVVQIWSGYLASTAPEWALQIRKPVNIPITKAYEHFEGVIETSSWFGPLFTNIRLTRSDVWIDFHKATPLFQAQPLRRECYDKPPYEVLTVDDLCSDDWQRFGAILERNHDNMRCPGHYAVETRKRLRIEAAD